MVFMVSILKFHILSICLSKYLICSKLTSYLFLEKFNATSIRCCSVIALSEKAFAICRKLDWGRGACFFSVIAHAFILRRQNSKLQMIHVHLTSFGCQTKILSSVLNGLATSSPCNLNLKTYFIKR